MDRTRAHKFSVIDATALTPDFKVCEPGLANPSTTIRIINTSNINIIISYDGVYSNDIVLADDFIDLYIQFGHQPKSNKAIFPKGMVIYAAIEVNFAKGGDLYIVSYY